MHGVSDARDRGVPCTNQSGPAISSVLEGTCASLLPSTQATHQPSLSQPLLHCLHLAGIGAVDLGGGCRSAACMCGGGGTAGTCQHPIMAWHPPRIGGLSSMHGAQGVQACMEFKHTKIIWADPGYG